MRINVQGEASEGLRVMLMLAGLYVTETFPTYTVRLLAHNDDYIILDSVDSALERNVLNCIAELTDRHVLVKRAGGIQSEREIEISVPRDATVERAIEVGVLRAMLKLSNQPESKLSRFWQFLKSL